MTLTGRFRRGDEPNIQNIPVRTEVGTAIRDAFTGRRDFNGAEQAMVKRGDEADAKVAWHARTGR